MEKLEINDWVKGLSAIQPPQFTLEYVFGYLMDRGIEPRTLTPFLHWSLGSYTRNLIYKCPLFEVLAICWEPGQFSQVHNHRDQNCWMAVPIGRLQVQNFRVEQRDPVAGQCRLSVTETFEMNENRPAAVAPHAPVHQVLNLPEFAQRAVSIHVYSRPFDSCEVYSPEKGTYYDVPLHYTSEYGRKNPQEGRA
jgi:cysteine dioxygenase